MDFCLYNWHLQTGTKTEEKKVLVYKHVASWVCHVHMNVIQELVVMNVWSLLNQDGIRAEQRSEKYLPARRMKKLNTLLLKEGKSPKSPSKEHVTERQVTSRPVKVPNILSWFLQSAPWWSTCAPSPGGGAGVDDTCPPLEKRNTHD